MAKMFYTLEEAGRKLGKSADQVKKMVESGQLQEFRDGDKLVVKREQVEAMISDEDAPITLADSGEISLADSAGGSGTGAGESTKERSGISIFEADELDNTADASAQTQVTASVGGVRVPDAGGSGSGLLDLTRDSSDDTGLGAGLMQDIYNSSDSADEAAPVGAAAGGGALFENTGVASDAAGIGAPVMMFAEPIDGVGSGLAGGLAFGMIVALLIALFAVIAGLAGAASVITGLGGSVWALVGAAAGVTLIAGGVGAFIGSRNK